jgi:Uma2 family endonuclease
MDENRQSRGRTAVAAPRRWRFTVKEFQRMAETGILTDDARVELLEGELFAMPPIGDWHNGSVDGFTHWFGARIGDRALLRVQGSFRLSPHSQPQPDILLLRFRSDFYRHGLPGPEDVLLLVEVSDSSLDYDRDTKLPLYARAGIADVWIATRQPERIEVYREPEGEQYRSVTVVERGGVVTPLVFPDLALRVADILG